MVFIIMVDPAKLTNKIQFSKFDSRVSHALKSPKKSISRKIRRDYGGYGCYTFAGCFCGVAECFGVANKN